MTDSSSNTLPSEAVASTAVVSLKDLRYAAIGLLARREHSRRELRQKLQRRFGDDVEFDAALDVVLDGLAEENLQSDSRFAEAYTRMRNRKGYGPVRVLMELRERGITDELASGWVYSDEHDWFESAGIAWRKKFDAVPTDPKERAKQMRFLQYRGFSHEHISEILS